MKRIIFVAPSLKVGGIERALVEQVNHLSSRGEITLFLFSKSGDYIKDVSPNVKLKYGNFFLHCIGLTKKESKARCSTYIVRNLTAVFVKFFGRTKIFKFIFNFSQRFYGYDIAISYVHDQGPKSMYSGCNQFILSNIEAKTKYAWIHSDPTMAYIDKKMYTKMDGVVNVSMAMKNKFDSLNIIPKSKSYCIYNRINIDNITLKSHCFNPYNSIIDRPILVTVGRLEPLKGTVRLLEIANQLHLSGLRFKWYFVGDGVLYDYCQKYILEHALVDKIILTGNQSNPYPYISNADICVSGSKAETFGLSIVESLILGLKVVAYRYDAINEIIDSSNGIICDNYDEIYQKLTDVIKSTDNFFDNKTISIIMDYNEENNRQIEIINKL